MCELLILGYLTSVSIAMMHNDSPQMVLAVGGRVFLASKDKARGTSRRYVIFNILLHVQISGKGNLETIFSHKSWLNIGVMCEIHAHIVIDCTMENFP